VGRPANKKLLTAEITEAALSSQEASAFSEGFSEFSAVKGLSLS